MRRALILSLTFLATICLTANAASGRVEVSAKGGGRPLYPVSLLRSDGSLVVAWESLVRGDYNVYAQIVSPTGATLWEDGGKPLVVGDGYQRAASLVETSDGFVLIWEDSARNESDIVAQRYDNNGAPQWESPGVSICSHPALKASHHVVADGHGGFFVTWVDQRSGDLDVYGQRITAGGAPAWESNGTVICRAPGPQHEPRGDLDGMGGVIVTWTDVSTAEWRVGAQRMSRSGERLWGDSGAVASLSRGRQATPYPVGDEAGGARVFWVDYRNDDGSLDDLDIYGQRFTRDGERLWGNEAYPVCAVVGTQRNLTAVGDGFGGAYLAWVDTRDVFDDIYAQHILPDDRLIWLAEGLAVCVEAGVQRTPSLAADASGMWAVWSDYRRDTENESQQDIYIQRHSAFGEPGFPRDGTPLITDSAGRADLSLHVRNGAAAITWLEFQGRRASVVAWLANAVGAPDQP